MSKIRLAVAMASTLSHCAASKVNVGTIGHVDHPNKFAMAINHKRLTGRGKGNKYEAKRIRGW